MDDEDTDLLIGREKDERLGETDFSGVELFERLSYNSFLAFTEVEESLVFRLTLLEV